MSREVDALEKLVEIADRGACALEALCTAVEAIAAIECQHAVPADRMRGLACEWSRLVGDTGARLRRSLHEQSGLEDPNHVE